MLGRVSQTSMYLLLIDRFHRSQPVQWKADRPRSVTTIQAHQSCTYQALFSPHQPDLISTCSSDGTLKIFDIRSPAYATGQGMNSFTNPLTAAVLTVPASASEILTLDWNKYRPLVLASGSVDRMVKVWDCRMVKMGDSQVGGACENSLPGHEYAVRKVQWSPHKSDFLATASYDMTCRMSVFVSLAGLSRTHVCFQMEYNSNRTTASTTLYT